MTRDERDFNRDIINKTQEKKDEYIFLREELGD